METLRLLYSYYEGGIVMEENEDTTLIECSECEKEVFVENGTWALDKGMCEPCYAWYQGG